MIREIDVKLLTEEISKLCIQATHFLSQDMVDAFQKAYEKERKPLAKEILSQLQENLSIAGEDMIPICQDTGMAVIFMEVGQDVHFVGGDLYEAINKGVAKGYTEGYLRKSVVEDPLLRVNTKDNTPAVIHYSVVPGDQVKITLAPKGFGSENMSKVYMLKPADGKEGVVNSILDAISAAGPNACPPLVIGAGLGGDFELAAKMAKHALTLPVEYHSPKEHIAEIEREVFEKANQLNIGPAGLGGDTTVLAVHIESFPTHIAGMPLAVNMCCHVNRHASVVI
ncbi:MAG: fumarate hydratase [Lachnospiraceae bacterium]|nr:fumarate hydratase [Lachnospiraceae bacterium]